VGLLDRLAPRSRESDPPVLQPASDSEPLFSTKAFRKFLPCFNGREAPVLLDLGPTVGGNISFFGEQLGCKIFIEDLFADLDRHVQAGTTERFTEMLRHRFPQQSGSVDGIICWDIIDYLDRPAAQVLAEELARVLRPDGALLAFFATVQTNDPRYTKYVIADEENLRRRSYPAARCRQTILMNRDIIRLFPTLRVSDSFLLQNNLREILFRKPA
jgi:2-polyprenyl-3-methyl-5-hydroxy-6-metoxy-1,4-benzoquinol methylase